MSTIHFPSLHNLCTDFFSPLAHEHTDSSHSAQSKDVFDLVCDYVVTNTGSWDFYRLVECIVSLVQFLIAHPEQRAFADTIAKIIDTAGIALSLPKTIADTGSFRHSIRHFISVHSIPYAIPEHSKIIAHAYKHVIVDMMSLTNTGSQAALYLHAVGIHPLQCVPFVNTLYNVTSLGLDTIEGIDKIFEVHYYHTQNAQTDRERAAIQEKKHLALLKIGKNILSIAGVVLAIAMTFFSSFNIPAVAVISLCLNTLWLSMKLASALYERHITDRARSTAIA